MGMVGRSKEKQGKKGGKTKKPISTWKGQRKPRVQCLYPDAGLAKKFNFLLFLRLEGLGAGRSLFMPLAWATMGISQGSNGRRPLDPFLVPKSKSYGAASIQYPPTHNLFALERLGWEHAPLSLKW